MSVALQLNTGSPPAKDVLQTYTGRVLKPLDPWPGDFDIQDIAWSLAMQCRYNGHTKVFYSVAAHSILVSEFLPLHLRLEGLLHDASEAYLSDLPSPIKQQMPEYRKVEEQLESVIATQFHLIYPMHPKVKWADDYVFQLECGLVMGGEIARKFAVDSPERDIVESAIIRYAAWNPEVVAQEFLRHYRTITETRGADLERAFKEKL